MHRSNLHLWVALALLLVSACGVARAQDAPPPPAAPVQETPVRPPAAPEKQLSVVESPMPEMTRKSPAGNCFEPAPVVAVENYQGAYEKSAGLFVQKLEYKTVKSPRYKPHAALCILPLSQKFELFAHQAISAGTFAVAAVNGGVYDAARTNPGYGDGFANYARNYAASVTDQSVSALFKTVVYPTIFREDPRYYRLGRGPAGRRVLHAFEHAVVAHSEAGRRTFNFSEWLGTGSAAAVSNTYHPDYQRGWGPGLRRVVITIGGWDAGFDVLREFWPEFAHKLHLPHPGAGQSAAPSRKN